MSVNHRYRIRELNDVEKAAKVTKEIKQLRAFEQSILLNYKAFIASLVTIIKSAQTKQTKKPLSDVDVNCATSLLVAVPSFQLSHRITQNRRHKSIPTNSRRHIHNMSLS